MEGIDVESETNDEWVKQMTKRKITLLLPFLTRLITFFTLALASLFRYNFGDANVGTVSSIEFDFNNIYK